MKSIVLITTGQPSLNPRIVKEAESLNMAGYRVTVLYCFWITWATATDKKLLHNTRSNYKLVGGSPHGKKITYLKTRLRFKLNRYLNKNFGNKYLIAERAQARGYDELLHAAKKINADWYVGHNLGALPIAVKAALFNKASCGFDFEDYHRGENFPPEKNELHRIIFLENKYLPSLQYFSTSSELITDVTKKNHPFFTGSVITLRNCFPLNQQPLFIEKKDTGNKLELFWFSQTIGMNRGLEALIEAILILSDTTIHLTLAGRCDEAMLDNIKKNSGEMLNNIHFAGIIQPEELPAFAAKFDIGMAIELTIPENRNLCLTNKIFTYLLAGNAIIFSETLMQLSFNKRYKIGESFAVNNVKDLAQKIKAYQDPQKLNAQRRYNYELAKTQLNWEMESKKLLALLK